MSENLEIKKAGLKDIKNYSFLLNSYYSEYHENHNVISYRKEIFKRIITSILSLFSKKYRTMTQLYLCQDNKEKVGFIEYCNTKVCLLNGFLRKDNILMHQAHFFKRFRGKGYAQKFWTISHNSFHPNVTIYGLVNSTNIRSQKAVVKVNFKKYKEIEYLETQNGINYEKITSTKNTEIKDYKKKFSKLLYNLYCTNTPQEIFCSEKLDPDTFKDGLFDSVIDRTVNQGLKISEKKYALFDKDKFTGFFVTKIQNNTLEIKLITDKKYRSLAKDVLLKINEDINNFNISKLFIYINAYQTWDISILKEAGFKSKRTYFEYSKKAKSN